MRDGPKQFRRPPKKYQPKGLRILHEDRDILVVDKACGLLTVSTAKVKENTAYFLLNEYVRKGNRKSPHRVFIVHRLDRGTSGVLVFAKTGDAQRYLQDEWQQFQKTYYALVHGALPQPEGVFTSYLAENRARRVYSVTDSRQGKFAETGYKVLRETETYSLLEVALLTGRKNQIRVHLAEQGFPVVGDKKYGVKDRGIKRLMLHAASLSIVHPFSREPLTFATKIPGYFKSLMKAAEHPDE